MAVGMLDINDCNVQLWHDSGHLQSPGYALLDGDAYVFGNAARSKARLRPRDVNTRFWWQLGTDPLPSAMGPARHNGDLVHAHLQSLHREGGQPSEILMTVSDSMQREQLSLLLGIVNQCPFAAAGLINRSVVLASLYPFESQAWHLEIQLHQAVLARLQRRGNDIELVSSSVLPECGLLRLQERFIECVAGQFVEQTRFDPRRRALAEQTLYDALPGLLGRLRAGAEANLEIDGYRARILRTDLMAAGRPLYQRIREQIGSGSGSLLAEQIASLLPGLDNTLGDIHFAAEGAIQSALAAHGASLLQREANLHYVTALPCLNSVSPEPSAPAQTLKKGPSPGTEPTHLLCGHVARPLNVDTLSLDNGWQLRRTADGWQLRPGEGPAEVNGVPRVDAIAVAAGDAIRIGTGPGHTLIAVQD